MSEAPTKFPHPLYDTQLLVDEPDTRKLDAWFEWHLIGAQHWDVYSEAYGYRDLEDWNYQREQLMAGSVRDEVPHYTTNAKDFYNLGTSLRLRLNPTQLRALDDVYKLAVSAKGADLDCFENCLLIRQYLKLLHTAGEYKLVDYD